MINHDGRWHASLDRSDYRVDNRDRVLRGSVWIANVTPAHGRRWRAATVDGTWIGDDFDCRNTAFMACVRFFEAKGGGHESDGNGETNHAPG